MSKKGRRFEHDVARKVTEMADDDTWCWPAGWSGNNSWPSPDIITVTPAGVRCDELKRYSDTFYIDASDLEQLLTLRSNYVHVGLVVDFAHREPTVLEPVVVDTVDVIGSFIEGASSEQRRAFGLKRVDGSDGEEESSLRVEYPSLDDWPSQQSCGGSAEEVAARKLVSRLP